MKIPSCPQMLHSSFSTFLKKPAVVAEFGYTERMSNHYGQKSARHSAVVVAVRERYQKVRQSIPELTAEVERARKAAEEARLRLNEAKDELAELGDYLEQHLDQAEREPSTTLSPGPKRIGAFDIETRVEAILSKASPLKTLQIWKMLTEQGVELSAANPIQRISQILSESDRFRNDRTHGWSLATAQSSIGGLNHELPGLPELTKTSHSAWANESTRVQNALTAAEQALENAVADIKRSFVDTHALPDKQVSTEDKEDSR